MSSGSNKAYEVLRQRIVAGQYSPGSQMKEEPIAREMSLSRTPVRSALKRLVDDGLATDEQGRGVRVAAWTDWDVEEIYELRFLLEPYVAHRAAESGSDEDVEVLEASNQQMAAAIAAASEDSISHIQAANRLFHTTLLRMSGSRRLRDMLESMIDMPVMSRSFLLYNPDDLNRSLTHHREITMAVRTHDGPLARQAMQFHLQASMRRFTQLRSVHAEVRNA